MELQREASPLDLKAGASDCKMRKMEVSRELVMAGRGRFLWFWGFDPSFDPNHQDDSTCGGGV